MRILPPFSLFLLVLMVSCSAPKQFFQPPYKNCKYLVDTCFSGDEFPLKAMSRSMFGLAIQDIFQRSLFDKLLLDYPSLLGLITGNNRIDISIGEMDSRAFSDDYLTRIAAARKINPDTFGVSYHTYSPSYFNLYYVLPKSVNGNFITRKIDFDNYADSARLRRSSRWFPFSTPFIDSPLQVFNLPLPNTKATYHFQPGGFLIAIPDRLIVDQSGETYHPENRFIVLNSHVFNYKRNVQVFFFHFLYFKSKFRLENFYFQTGFNQFIDSVNLPSYKGINPYTRFVTKEQLIPSLEEFMHLVLYAEYSCREKPVFVKMTGKYVYTFKFYSEIKRSYMMVDFDLRKIKILSVKEVG